MRARTLAAAILALASLEACAKPKPPKASSPPAPMLRPEEGLASWYGDPYHGRRAANGERYDMEKLTAAHRTLPFETWVEVRNLSNGQTVEVRITDRGPFVHGRIIDLSRAAARRIGMLGPGTARVRLNVVRGPSPAPAPSRADLGFAVQIGAFRDKSRAENLKRSLEARYRRVQLVPREASPMVWRVLVGVEPAREQADSLAGRLRADGYDVFVVRLDAPHGK